MLYISHRGEAAFAPEGSAPSFRLAMEQHADIVKLDIQETADGVPVISHDPNMRRTAGSEAKFRDLTLADLKKKYRFIPVGGYGDECFITLDEALDIVACAPQFELELKAYSPELVRRALAQMQRRGIGDERIIVPSWFAVRLEEIHRLHPRLRTVQHVVCEAPLGDGLVRWYDRDHATPEEFAGALLELKEKIGLFGVNIPAGLPFFDREWVTRLQRGGLWVSAWLVNDPVPARHCFEAGVDALVTDAIRTVRVE